MNFVRDVAWLQEAHQFERAQREEGENKRSFWAKAVSVHQHEPGAALPAKKVATVKHRGYVTLEGFVTLGEAPRKALRSLD